MKYNNISNKQQEVKNLIGLEYVLNLYNIQHKELAENLGIKKQNINMWVKGRQNIPKKYLPVLERLFGINRSYFGRLLTEIDQLEIQKEKLKQDLKPIIKKHEQKFSLEKANTMVEVPIYDKEEINAIERDIEKVKLISRFKTAIYKVDKNPYIDTYQLIVELLEKAQHESILHKTIEALAHYFEVLPDGISSDSEQKGFEGGIFEVFDEHNY